MKSELSSICYYAKGKIPISKVTKHNYVSTENLLPNRGGLVEPASIPTIPRTQSYNEEDVLVSNIRPYFKKIWYAKNKGGCSNDVLVFRAKEGVDSRFLYYVLANDAFFAYSTATSKGTKMPRGDKEALMKYPVLTFDFKTQKKIAEVLGSLDDKIELNNTINKNLEQQLVSQWQQLRFQKKWSLVPVADIASKIAMGPFGSNIKVSTFVPTGVPIISGNHLRGYFLEDSKFNYITESHAEKIKNSIVYPHDIVFTHAGNIGQVAMIPDTSKYPSYVLSQRQFYLRCKETRVIPEYVLLFFLSKEGQHELLSFANQTGVPSISQPVSSLKKILIPLPPLLEQKKWFEPVEKMIGLYLINRKINERLTALRDLLLPKLISGKLDVSQIDI